MLTFSTMSVVRQASSRPSQRRRRIEQDDRLRNYTYAKFGRAILQQPEHAAFQIWDAQTSAWLQAEEYREERAERLAVDTIEELADLCASRGLLDRDAFLHTIKEYNSAVHACDAEAAPARNPANVLGRQETAQLVDRTGNLTPAVYCVGEMLGVLSYGNYPGGSGLTSGTVFGRRAGEAAAEYIKVF
ncbi:hypothetical protein PWT90_10447 [Aphanocladium album]|nr:hypothetical protein PWT90_10447 [Aphanocladium album]